MTKNKFFIGLFIAVLIFSIIGCGSSEVAEPAPVEQQALGNVEAAPVENEAETEAKAESLIEADTPVEVVDKTEAEIEAKAEPLGDAVEIVDKVEVEESPAETAVEPEVDELVAADVPVEAPAEEVEESVVTKAPEEVTKMETAADETDTMVEAESVEFTATTGLDTFSAYQLNFVTDFDGTRNDQPTTGSMSGLFEATKNPEAKHWRVDMGGNAFQELAMLGGKMELYDMGNTIYIQGPDGTWVGMPAMLVDSMLPADMGNPEDSIELPVTAMRHPGQEIVNDVVTQRYTFGPEDLAGDSVKYEHVEGTIWVAVDGNYVVKYEAEVTGQHNLSAGGIHLLDEGTITMAYEVTDVNSDFAIAPPEGTKAVNLADLLFQ